MAALGAFTNQSLPTASIAVAQGTSLSGQFGVLMQAAVTITPPTYSDQMVNPLSLDAAGNLRVNVTAGGAGGGIVTANFGGFADGSIVTIGTEGDAPWIGSGAGTVISILKGIFNRTTGGGGGGGVGMVQAIFFDTPDADEPFIIPGPAGSPGATGAPGTPGSPGAPGPIGPVYIEAYEADEPPIVPGPIGPPGGVGPQGITGGLGPAVYLEAPEADEPLTVPGTQGPPGGVGPTGGQGAIGPVYIEAYEADEPFPIPGSAGPQGAAGTPGTTGAQGPIGPVYIEAYEADEPPIVPGPVGPPGGAGAPGGVGPQGATAYLEGPDGEEGAAGPPGLPGTAGAPGNPGTTGAPGPIGPVYIEAYEADEPFPIPGTPGAAGTPGTTGGQGPAGPPIYLEAADGEEGTPGPPGLTGPAGSSGTTGGQGPIGPPIYLEAEPADEPIMVPGVLPGPQGNPGVTGAPGPIGPPVYLQAEEPDETMLFPGVAGPIGPAGLGQPGAFLNTLIASVTATTSATYVMGGCNTTITPLGSGRILLSISGTLANGAAAGNACAVYVAYGTGTPPVNGAAATGTDLTGAQILSLPASGDLPFCQEGVIDGLTKGQTYWIDIAFHTTGAQSAQPQNITIAAVEQGGASAQTPPSGQHFTVVETEEPIHPMMGQGTDPLASLGSVGNPASLASVTTINDTVTPTSGGVTFAAPPIAKGHVYRIRAFGIFTTVNSATARNAQIRAVWGATALTAWGVPLATSVASANAFLVEYYIVGLTATTMWVTTNMLYSFVPPFFFNSLAPASVTVTAGPQTLDLQFSMSVAVATDSWAIHNVTMERLA